MSITKRRESRTDDGPMRVLDDEGHLLPGAARPDASDEELLALYEQMRLARHFDERAVRFQRQGRIATYAPMSGQEGAQVASAMALDDEDWIFPTYRDNGAKMARGIDPADILASLAGHPSGYARPEESNVMPEYIPIATQIPQAVGAAWASKLKGERQAFLSYFGDGATSEGDFHEGLNFAGVFDAPAVFFCNNNQYAISTPRDRQTAAETLAQKATAYGFEGVQVDGMDPLAVYEVTRAAVEKAKDPNDDERRPTLVEAVQYRFGAHTTSDDPSVYRENEEEAEWRERDPIPRLETYLRDEGILDDGTEAAIQASVEQQVAEAIVDAEERISEVQAMFENVYAEPTDRHRQQAAYVQQLRERHGDEALTEDHH